MPQDRAKRPEPSSGNGPSSPDGGASAQGDSLSEMKAAGTYFLGRYRIVDEIGIGGMASVHLARMDGPGGFQKWVAIKKIHAHLVEDESFVQMFLDEARVAARISHPNVATVFDLGKHDSTYWIAMEYLHGEPLREVMRRTEELGTAMPPEIACRVIADAAEGLHAAHELLGKNGEKLGLVHRDVTPHNLFVTYDGVTKVVDFGIAKFSSRMSQTRAGTLKGKLAYMSPEQVQGEGIDRRTDIFALGVVLWELTTGQRLFRMDSDLDTLAKVQECNVPRPSTLIRGYPVDLEKIVMKTLAKNRGERFKTARELSRALQSLLMRRGLFIASDEVAAYTQSIFAERIRKREAHLRWASDVTQTINVEKLRDKPALDPEFTSSEVQPSVPEIPRAAPAAGMPPWQTSGADPPRHGAPPSGGYESASFDGQETAIAHRRGAGRAGSGRPPAPPRPAAGAPAESYPPPSAEEQHPADADGPTIQGVPAMMVDDEAASSALGEPPTLLAVGRRTREARGNGAPGVDVLDEAELEEDQDETLVAEGRQQAAAPSFTQPPPSATSFENRASLRGPHGQGSGDPSGSLSYPPGSYGGGQPGRGGFGYPGAPTRTGEVPFAEPPISSQTPMGPYPGHAPDYGAHPPTYPGIYGPQGSYSASHPTFMPPAGPTDRRHHAGRDNRTMTAQRFRRRPPMWIVAALSCSVALLVAGVVVAIISWTSPQQPRPNEGASGGAAVGTSPPGPFAAARTAFITVASPTPASAPTSAVVPPVMPTPSAPAPAAAPTTTSAAASAAPPSTAPPPGTASPATRPVVAPAPLPRRTAALGALTIVCLPKCDQIIDNGAALGPGHIFNRPVPSGHHVLVLSAPNGVRKTVQVEVVPEQTREVRLSMDKP